MQPILLLLKIIVLDAIHQTNTHPIPLKHFSRRRRTRMFNPNRRQRRLWTPYHRPPDIEVQVPGTPSALQRRRTWGIFLGDWDVREVFFVRGTEGGGGGGSFGVVFGVNVRADKVYEALCVLLWWDGGEFVAREGEAFEKCL
jgi:hypothetical protein